MEADSHFLEFVSSLGFYYSSPHSSPTLGNSGPKAGQVVKKGVCFSKAVRNFAK